MFYLMQLTTTSIIRIKYYDQLLQVITINAFIIHNDKNEGIMPSFTDIYLNNENICHCYIFNF